MEHKKALIKLPEGNFVTNVTTFDESDVRAINAIYDSWRDLCAYFGVINKRSMKMPEELYLPEDLSEISFALAKDVWRLSPGATDSNYSFNFYDPYAKRKNNRLQVRTCQMIPDLTPFGSDSQWDRIFFVDFYREGQWDGTFDVYELNSADLSNLKANTGRTRFNRTILKKEPVISVYSSLIQKGKYKAKETFLIIEKGILKL